MKMSDLSDILEGLAPAVVTLVEDAVAGVSAELSSLKSQVELVKGQDITPAVREAVAAELAKSPPPEPAKSVTVDDVEPLIILAVQKQVAALPKPLDGKDASPEAIESAVAAAVAKIEKPQDGKDADPEFVRALVKEAVDAIPRPEIDYARIIEGLKGLVDMAVASIPKPQDGKDADAEAITKTVLAKVSEVLDAIPVPKNGENGKDADPEVIASEVAKAVALIPAPKGVDPEELEVLVNGKVADAVKAIPTPQDGKDADPALIAAEVAKAIAAIPAPAPGKDADPAMVQKAVNEAVAEAVAALPKPEPGKSVTIEDVAPLITDEVAKAVAAIPKPADGKSVEPEVIQKMVDAAVSSIVLPEPKHGEPGRDATDIDILPSIDTQKSYPRGVYATHLGGLWRSHGTTEGMRGWECIVDGIATQEIKQVDERTFEIVLTRSSGVESKSTLSVPMVLDCGVFKEDRSKPYQKGDGCTWGGSFWIAQQETNEKPDSNTGAWRLAVKKGEHGADAYRLAVRSGFEGTMHEWLESLKAKK